MKSLLNLHYSKYMYILYHKTMLKSYMVSFFYIIELLFCQGTTRYIFEGSSCCPGCSKPEGRGRVLLPHDDRHETLQLQRSLPPLAAAIYARRL